MQLTFLKGYPDYVGKRFIFAGFGSGPASYVPTGDAIQFPRYGNYIDFVNDAVTISGRYLVQIRPSNVGARATYYAIWSTMPGLVNAVTVTSAGNGMTPGTYTVQGTGGGGAGAVATVVVAPNGTVTATPTVTNAGFGYNTAPTFTMPAAAGGTPATFNATITTAQNVPAGTNLSGEQVQLGGYGGQY